jgi:hypothetical protein
MVVNLGRARVPVTGGVAGGLSRTVTRDSDIMCQCAAGVMDCQAGLVTRRQAAAAGPGRPGRRSPRPSAGFRLTCSQARVRLGPRGRRGRASPAGTGQCWPGPGSRLGWDRILVTVGRHRASDGMNGPSYIMIRLGSPESRPGPRARARPGPGRRCRAAAAEESMTNRDPGPGPAAEPQRSAA